MHTLIRSAAVTSLSCFCFSSAWAGERADQLKTALKDADRITVTTVEPGEKTKPGEIKNKTAIAELVTALDFDDSQSGFHCMCLSDSEVTFYQGQRKLAALSHHHGRSLRWNDGKWEDDSLFTPETARLWRTWFKKHGEDRFEKMHEQQVEEAKKEREEFENFVKQFPRGAAAIFINANDGMRTFSPDDAENEKKELSPSAKKLTALFDDPVKLVIAASRALGTLDSSGNGSWSMSTSLEQLVFECIQALEGATFLRGLNAGGADTEFMLGAARLFFFEKMGAKLPVEQAAMWSARLVETVLAKDHCDNAGIAMRSLENYRGQPVTDVMVRLASGLLPVAASKDGEDPTPRAAACITLAKAGHPQAKALVAKLEATGKLKEVDAAACRIARSLMGERGLLKAEIFELDSYTIGFGALAALEKEGGRAALDAIITGCLENSYAAVSMEGVLTVERMTGQKWYQNQKNERPDWHTEKVQKWWAANRDKWPLESPATKSNAKPGQ